MGTRNLTCVVLGGEFKVAQYCQWDGYPDGQGKTVLEFLSQFSKPEYALMDPETAQECTAKLIKPFIDKVDALRVATEDEIKQLWLEVGADDSGWVTIDVSNRMAQKYPQFQRNMGADVLQAIMDGKVDTVDLQTDFAQDGLFCEYAYVVDLDSLTLHAYVGFCKNSGADHGHFAPKDGSEAKPNDSCYYPVVFVKAWPIYNLPEIKQFKRDIYKAKGYELDDEDNDE